MSQKLLSITKLESITLKYSKGKERDKKEGTYVFRENDGEIRHV